MQPHEPEIDLGSCCACGRTGLTVRTILMLALRLPPEHRKQQACWGCLVCGLIPPEGAIAVLCDECVKAKRQPNLVVVGEVYQNERMPIESLAEAYQHDPHRHNGARNVWRVRLPRALPTAPYGHPN